MSTLKTPFRYDFVGSFLRPQALKDAKTKYQNNDITKDEYDKIVNEEITKLVAKQKELGFHAITDGEFRRTFWHLDFMWGFDGVEHKATGGGVPFNDELAVLDDTYLIGKFKAKAHPFVEYFKDYVDVFDVSAGLTCSIQYQYDADYLPDGWKSYMSKSIKEKTGKPCQTSGNIREPEVANRILEDGEADLIAIGRGLIADPEWVNKVQFGNTDDINRCISCNNGCTATLGDEPIRCSINPALVSGSLYKDKKLKKPCNVVVVGGGTAGLEAACTAAEEYYI